jgi:hypothetical protein
VGCDKRISKYLPSLNKAGKTGSEVDFFIMLCRAETTMSMEAQTISMMGKSDFLEEILGNYIGRECKSEGRFL